MSRLILVRAAAIAVLAFAANARGSAPAPTERVDSVPFVGGREGYAVYRTPAIVLTARGTILAFCEGRVNDHRDEGDIDTVLKRSVDGGRTWGPLQVLANDGANPCKNACPVVLPSGRILAVYLWNAFISSKRDRSTREVYAIHSDDDGLTWSKPRSITSSVYLPGWHWYGTGPCHAIVKRKPPHAGRIVVPARHNSADMHMQSHIIYSDDDGATWLLGGNVARERTSEATVVELSNGDLLINSRNQNGSENQRVSAVSRDGGASFKEIWLDLALVEPRGCQASLVFHSVNERTGKGNIVFSNPANETARADGTLKLSEDDGRTWSRSFRYAPKPEPYFTGYSDIVVLPNGDIGVLYERGDFHVGERKAERYDEMGFTTVGFGELAARGSVKSD